MDTSGENIRNFCIIAHIDHGKSTLADRLLEITGTVEKRLMKAQYLDSLELERERGITIKMAPVRMIYRPEIQKPKLETLNNTKFQNSNTKNASLEFRNSDLGFSDSEYILNLIDTPGHSDFGYEVSRALAAVEGAILLVDATQGIQAQTLANFESAKKAGLTIIGVVNKIDVAHPDQVEEAVSESAELLGADAGDILRVSGKTGEGVPALLEAVIKKVPPPEKSGQSADVPMHRFVRALIFDSLYDEHKGIIAFVRVFDGVVKTGNTIFFLATKTSAKAKEVGYFAPELKRGEAIMAGETGYIATGIKDPNQLRIGDTIALDQNTSPLAGYKEPQPVVFVSFYPADANQYDDLKSSLEKLHLTDAALRFEPDMSEALGRGFKGGFLGRLHFEITAERLEREFDIATVHSFPSVAYKVKQARANSEKNPGKKEESDFMIVNNPKDFPVNPDQVLEPVAAIEILTPSVYVGPLLQLKELFRLSNIETRTLGIKTRITAKLPLADLVSDFDDKLKSISKGYASLSYTLTGYELADVAKLEILLNGNIVPGLTRIVARKDIEREGRATVEKLKKLLPREQFAQMLQAASGSRIIAREDISAMKKDVAGYLYGGDRTRKMKLWKKQQRGKKKLKEMASQSQVKIPAHIFKELLKR